MIYLVCSNKEKALGHTTLDTQNQQILFNLISVLLPFKTGKKKGMHYQLFTLWHYYLQGIQLLDILPMYAIY